MNYTGIFLNDSHMTWNFGFPLGVIEEAINTGNFTTDLFRKHLNEGLSDA